MSRMVQVKGVPEPVHRALKSRAALRGQTLSNYLRAEMERLAARPSADELLALLPDRPREQLGHSSADDVRAARERAS